MDQDSALERLLIGGASFIVDIRGQIFGSGDLFFTPQHAARKRLGCRYSRPGLTRSLKAGAARGCAIQAIDQDRLTSMLALICAGTTRLVDALNKFTRDFGFIRPGLVA